MVETAEKYQSSFETADGWLDYPKLKKDAGKASKIFLTAARNIGKTYSVLLEEMGNAVNAFAEDNRLETVEDIRRISRRAKSKYQFVFIRRSKTILADYQPDFFKEEWYQNFIENLDESIKDQFDMYIDFEGSIDGVRRVFFVFEDLDDPKIRKKFLIGHMGAISAHEIFRKAGIPEVQIIIFDEFQSKKHYDYYEQEREPVFLEDIYESITRDRAGEVKLIALGNSGSIVNPYFAYYDYDEFENEKTEKRDGTVVFYHLDNVAPNKKEGSAYRKSIEGSEYGDYSINNQFANLDMFNVIRLEDAAAPRQCLYNVVLRDVRLGVWQTGDGKIILSKRHDPEKDWFVDRVPIGAEVMNVSVYQLLADQIKFKFLFFDTPDVRLTAEKHLMRYIYKFTSEWDEAK